MSRSKKKFIQPAMVDVGRGPELAKISVRRGRAFWLLPEEGALVPWTGAEGHFWKRRLAEGGVALGDPAESRTPAELVFEELTNEETEQ